MHDLRVTARRLHAALTVFRPLLEAPRLRRRAIRRVERRLGTLRDLEVLGAMVRSLPPGDARAQLLERIGAEEAAARERGESALRRDGLRTLLDGLHRWLYRPAFTPLTALGPTLLLPDLLLPTLSRCFGHPGWVVAGVPSPDDPQAEALHALRRRIKQLRYRLECVAGWGGEELVTWLEELHAMQDALGAWHDGGVLLDRLQAVDDGMELAAPVRARALRSLECWPDWRARYTDPAFRRRAREWLEMAAAARG